MPQATGKHKDANAASWQRGEARKRVNREANEARAAANRLLRAEGLPTPHEVKKLKRKAIRDAARAAGTLAPIGMTSAEFNKNNRKATK